MVLFFVLGAELEVDATFNSGSADVLGVAIAPRSSLHRFKW